MWSTHVLVLSRSMRHVASPYNEGTLFCGSKVNGHFIANIDPLGLEPRPMPLELDPTLYGFTDADLDRECVPCKSPMFPVPAF